MINKFTMQHLPKTPYFIHTFADHTLINLRISKDNINIAYLQQQFPTLSCIDNNNYIYITAAIPTSANFLLHYQTAKAIAAANKASQTLKHLAQLLNQES
jgi:hypothetical protein